MQSLYYVEQSVQLATQRVPVRSIACDESTSIVNELWVHSKCRFRRWQETAVALETGIRGPEEYHAELWKKHLPNVTELCTVHVFTATWSAWQFLNNRKVWDNNPALKTGFADCRDIRLRTELCILSGYAANGKRRYRIQCVDDLAMLYKSSKKWVDLLLGLLQADASLAPFGFDSTVVEKYRQSVAALRRENADSLPMLGSKVLRDAQLLIERLDCHDTENVDLNRSIHQAMMALTNVPAVAR